MGINWQEVIISVFTTLGGGTIFLCAAAWLLKAVITHRLKATADAEIEKVKNALTKETEAFKIRLQADTDKETEQLRSSLQRLTLEHQAKISDVTWKRERKYELQLKAIESFNVATSDYISRAIPDPEYKPTQKWFASFQENGDLINALFGDEVYVSYKNVENLVGPGVGSIPGVVGKTTAERNFYNARSAAIKAMFNSVIGELSII